MIIKMYHDMESSVTDSATKRDSGSFNHRPLMFGKLA